MCNSVKQLFNKLNFFKNKRWKLESKYQLFYIDDAENILTTRFPVDVLNLQMHRPSSTKIHAGKSVALKKGDILKITVRNYKITPNMTVLERAGSVSRRCFSYKGDGIFEEVGFGEIPVYRNSDFVSIIGTF